MRKEYRRLSAKEKFIRYLCTTWKNKVMAIVMMVCGMSGMKIVDDVTFLAVALFIAVPMFFSSEVWI